MKYLRQNGNDCFCVSLANTLFYMGDKRTAKRVYDSYPLHPLRLPDGSMHGLLATKLVEDLTEGVYRGMFTVSMEGDDLEAGVRPMYSQKTEEVLRIIQDEMDKGRIRDHDGTIDYDTPAVLAVAFPFNVYFHWIVHADDNLFISNNRETSFNQGVDKYYNVIGVLELEKANS